MSRRRKPPSRNPARDPRKVIHGLGNDNCVVCSVCGVCRPGVGSMAVDVHENGDMRILPICGSCTAKGREPAL